MQGHGQPQGLPAAHPAAHGPELQGWCSLPSCRNKPRPRTTVQILPLSHSCPTLGTAGSPAGSGTHLARGQAPSRAAHTLNSGVRSPHVQCLEAPILPLPQPTCLMAREAGTACAVMSHSIAQLQQGLHHGPDGSRQKRTRRFPPNYQDFGFYNYIILKIHLSYDKSF